MTDFRTQFRKAINNESARDVSRRVTVLRLTAKGSAAPMVRTYARLIAICRANLAARGAPPA